MMHSLELRIPPVLLVLLWAALMWGASVALPYPVLAFEGKAFIAGLVLILGIACALAGVMNFRRSHTTVNPVTPEETSAIVTSGIYRFSRNPMYLGFFLALSSWAILLSQLLAILLLPGFIAYMNRFQIQPEEKVLSQKFGAEFEEYTRAVRRWI